MVPARAACRRWPNPYRYNLRETPTDKYPQRTEWNVRDSDGTVIFTIGSVLKTGSKKTFDLAQKHHKPVLHLYQQDGSQPEMNLVRFIGSHNIRVLNVAGTRGSKEPEVGAFVTEVLRKALALLQRPSTGFSQK
jgi:hypothetical protein